MNRSLWETPVSKHRYLKSFTVTHYPTARSAIMVWPGYAWGTARIHLPQWRSKVPPYFPPQDRMRRINYFCLGLRGSLGNNRVKPFRQAVGFCQVVSPPGLEEKRDILG